MYNHDPEFGSPAIIQKYESVTPAFGGDKEVENSRLPELAGQCPSNLEESMNSRFGKRHKSQKLK